MNPTAPPRPAPRPRPAPGNVLLRTLPAHALTHAAPILVGALLVVGGLPAARGDESLASLVPASVGLFVEARGVDDLLVALTEPQVWLTLAELAGQPAGREDPQEWKRRIRQTVQFEPEHAIRILFSQRVAFVGEGLGRAQDAVVLCRVLPGIRVEDLLRVWGAEPLPGAAPVRTYRLPNQVGLAVHDHLLVFGSLVPPDGMLAHMVRQLGPQAAPRLADDAVFRELLRRVPDDPDGLMFARLGRAGQRPSSVEAPPHALSATAPATAPVAPETQPAGRGPGHPSGPDDLHLPLPLRGASHALLALHRRQKRLRFTLVGDGPTIDLPQRTRPLELAARLPGDTLLAWAGDVDLTALVRAADQLPERHVVRTALRFQRPSGTVDRLVEALDGSACLAAGVAEPPGDGAARPPLPALVAILGARDAEAAGREFAAVVQACATVHNFLALARGTTQLPPLREIQIDGQTVLLQDISPLLWGRDGDALPELHLCWTVDDDALLIASHLDWLRTVQAARHGPRRELEEALRAGDAFDPDARSLLVVRGAEVAALGQQWLEYLGRQWPEVLDPQWWRQRQPAGGQVQLGIDVTPVADPPGLRVVAVQPGCPADGLLRPGDTIVGTAGRRFSTTQPVIEMRELVERRREPRWVELLVQRDGTLLALRIPLPFVDLVETLRRVVAVGRLVGQVVYHDEVPVGQPPRGILLVELRDQPPATRPAPAATQPHPGSPP